VIPPLARTYRVVAPDLPGHGASGAGDARLDPEHVLGWLGELIEQTCPAPPIPPAELSRIAVPTTLIWGRHDMATPLQVAEEASVRYGWPLHVIEDAADDPPIEQPEAFLRALHTALETATARQAAL
jgi:pimeloyl-ACP methyl ester carboxylesterase